jgi:signal transduction histidine kinase
MLIVVFALVGIAVLGLVAWQLARAQSTNRNALRDRFAARAPIATSLIDALFRTALLPQGQSAQGFASGKVTDAALTEQARKTARTWLVVLDSSGHVLASAAGAPPGLARDGLRTFERAALRDGYGLSDALPGKPPTLATAVRFSSPTGNRLLVSGGPASVYKTFLRGTLAPLATSVNQGVVVLDGAGRPLASVGVSAADARIIDAQRRAPDGSASYRDAKGVERFSASSPVAGTRWRVVVQVSDKALYAPASGSARWIPWVILALCGAALIGLAVLLARLVAASSQVRTANARLGEANAQLVRSNADLEQFAYVASHDLSSPLRSIAGFSELIATRYRGRLDGDADGYIDFMREGVDRMQRIIDDLLAYSRVDQRPLRRDQVDLDDLLDELRRSLASTVADRDAQITNDPLPVVLGERGQLAQVLQNLITNATTYVAPGVVPRVHVAARREGADWRVTVTDNGLGVDREHAERIFKMFQRLDPDGAHPGTGIGLAISKRIVERHGGSLDVEPGADGGSTFSFTVPAAPVAVAVLT